MEGRGLVRKYVITKADGSPVEDRANYFVLRLDGGSPFSKASRAAAVLFARTIQEENPELAFDLLLEVALEQENLLEARERGVT